MAANVKVPAQRVSGKPVTRGASGSADLLAAIAEHIADRYSGLTDDEYLILAVWILHTYLYQACEFTVYLHIASLAPDAGKSALAKILADLCYDAERIVPTVATLGQYRESGKHTLIIDELDSLISSRNTDLAGLWQLLNQGNQPGTPWRVSGQPDRDMFFPKALIGIGPGILRDTVASRSIRIMAKPGTDADQTERERRQALRPVIETANALRYRLARFAVKRDIRAQVTAGMHDIATRTLNDGTRIINRDSDIWRVMIVTCDVMGADYGKRMREIAARYVNSEPEIMPTIADTIDSGLRRLMREYKITVINWLDGKAPLQGKVGYPLTDADFGWPAPRNGQRGKLPSASLIHNANERKTELRFIAREFPEICTALNMSAKDIKRAYADAGRLHAQAGRTSIPLPFKQGQGDVSVIAIDVSCWLWPDVIHTKTAKEIMDQDVAAIMAAKTVDEIWDADNGGK
jgi:hypothetical protein